MNLETIFPLDLPVQAMVIPIIVLAQGLVLDFNDALLWQK